MAVEQSDVAAPAEQRDAIVKKVNRVLKTVSSALAELTELVAALNDDTSRRVGKLDDNCEPTWAYLVKQKIPADIYLTKKFLEYGEEFGFTKDSMQILLHGLDRPGHQSYEGFKRYYQRKGTKWENWSLVFMKWVRTEHERKQKANAPGGPGTRFDQQRTRS